MIVWGKQCVKCRDIIWSRAGHDFKNCSCGTIHVDGGQGEFGGRVGWTPGFEPEHVILDVYGLNGKEMSLDWNHSKDTLGRIPRGTVDLRQQIVSIGSVRFDEKLGTEGDDDGEVRQT